MLLLSSGFFWDYIERVIDSWLLKVMGEITLTLKMEAGSFSETLGTWPTSAQYYQPST